MTQHQISYRDEECQCEQCGYPMYVGDVAVYTEGDRPACSVPCARKITARHAAEDGPDADAVRDYHDYRCGGREEV